MSIFSQSIRPLWLSLAVIASCVLLAVGSGETQDKEMRDTEGLKVSILLYSGRPDPAYVLDDKNTIGQLKALIGTAKPNDKFKKPTVIPSILGYKGVIVDNPNKMSGLPAFLAVYRGDIEVKDEFKKFLVDEGASVENLLLNEAMRKGVIDERILKSIKPD